MWPSYYLLCFVKLDDKINQAKFMNLFFLQFLLLCPLFQITGNFCFPYQQEADSKIWGPIEQISSIMVWEIEKMTSVFICENVHIATHLLRLINTRITGDKLCKGKCIAQHESPQLLFLSLSHASISIVPALKTFHDKISAIYVKRWLPFL